ncbi:MAG: helix-turn-helix domain-containing protein [Epulopiscium sp.]|nr:helix-turn-helix domain-containing protein [Candidatus Epulonipiscium sp.]
MKITTQEQYLSIYEALASKVRLRIIELLAEKPRNIKELAEALGLSSAIVTMHIRKLEEAEIVRGDRVRGQGGIQKICTLIVDTLEIEFPQKADTIRQYHEFILPVGHYTDFQAHPTCGLATKDNVIGCFDDPRYFLSPERVNAKILWFNQGYVEYKVPNYLLSNQTPYELQIILELSSEAPGVNSHWPSDISFFLNHILIGQWNSPGDFGGIRGKYTPAWWSLGLAQYGLLKVLTINEKGSYIDGQKVSDITLDQLKIQEKQWTFRISVEEDAEHIGGLTLFGSEFGNYNHDIIFRLYYS